MAVTIKKAESQAQVDAVVNQQMVEKSTERMVATQLANKQTSKTNNANLLKQVLIKETAKQIVAVEETFIHTPGANNHVRVNFQEGMGITEQTMTEDNNSSKFKGDNVMS